MKKKINIILQFLLIYLITSNTLLADLQKDLINKLETTQTLSFNFKQKIAEKEETGKCIIKYPLLMKCDYQDVKGKSLISNGRTVAIIKRKYKKIYYYPIKMTPLFILLKKEKIINMIKNNKPKIINSNVIEFKFVDEKSNKLKIFFSKNSLEFIGWETQDAYSNDVSFIINDLVTNKIIEDNLFKIPKEEDL